MNMHFPQQSPTLLLGRSNILGHCQTKRVCLWGPERAEERLKERKGQVRLPLASAQVPAHPSLGGQRGFIKRTEKRPSVFTLLLRELGKSKLKGSQSQQIPGLPGQALGWIRNWGVRWGGVGWGGEGQQISREQEACDGARGQGFMGLKYHNQILLLHPPIWLKTE